MLEKRVKEKKTFLIAGATFFAGILFFCFYQEWIIVHITFGTKPPATEASGVIEKKNVSLFFWKDNQWQKEEIEILWSKNRDKTLSQLVSRWLSLADEEEALPKKVMLQNGTISDSKNNAYLSFDRYPFSKESSTYEKHMIIEGLLRTIKESELKILSVNFLVHHKPIDDYHLDFSHPWPVYGFI